MLIFNSLGKTLPNLALSASPLFLTTTLQFLTYFPTTTLALNASKRKDVGKTTNQKKQVKKNSANNTVNNPRSNNSSSKKQIHHSEFHIQPDPPADLNLQPPAITKGIGAKWPNHNLIGSSLITSYAKRNSLDTITIPKSPISNDEISSQNPRLSKWITCNMTRIQNFSNRKLS